MSNSLDLLSEDTSFSDLECLLFDKEVKVEETTLPSILPAYGHIHGACIFHLPLFAAAFSMAALRLLISSSW